MQVALKKCENIWRHLDDAKRILREIKILQLMGSHENLLWLSDVFVWPAPTSPSSEILQLYIVSDLLETDLARIIESPQPLSNSHLKYFTCVRLCAGGRRACVRACGASVRAAGVR